MRHCRRGQADNFTGFCRQPWSRLGEKKLETQKRTRVTGGELTPYRGVGHETEQSRQVEKVGQHRPLSPPPTPVPPLPPSPLPPPTPWRQEVTGRRERENRLIFCTSSLPELRVVGWSDHLSLHTWSPCF